MPRSNDVIVFDTYAWVEYALDTRRAVTVARLLDSASEALTPATVIAELKDSMLRQNVPKGAIVRIIAFIKSRTTIVNIDSQIAEDAGGINFRNKKIIKQWGMLDSLVYAVATVRHGKVLTGDPDFKGLKNVIYIGDQPYRRPK